MKRFQSFVSLLVVACVGASAAPSTAQSHPQPAAPPATVKKVVVKVKVAPADEYFGKLKMSILGIANTIKDDGLKYDRQPETYPQLVNALNFAEDAIHDWERKYPNDPWIPRTLFALERFYQKVATEEGRSKAKLTMVWLVHDFPNTSFGKTGKEELASGKVGAPSPTANVDRPPNDITRPVLTDAPK